MSVMQNRQVEELALELAELLELDLSGQVDPYEPQVVVKALDVLFPEAEEHLRGIRAKDAEEQWNDVLEFIEIYMLQGERLEVQALGEEEIADIYTLIIDFTHQAMQENGGFQEQIGPEDMQKRQEEIKAEYKKQQKASRQKQQKKKQEKVTNKKQDKQQKQDKHQKQAKLKKAEQKKSKDVSKSKEKSKPKSSSKGKQRPAPRQKPSQIQEKRAPNPIPKESPPKSKPKPKKSAIADQPMQNQAIHQITTAMQGKRKQNKRVLLKDPKSTEEVIKAKRQFDSYLGQFKREGKDKRASSKRTGQKKGILDQYFLKALQRRQKNIQETVINEQLRYFLALRDKKVAFINKIHKLTETLERERIVQKEKKQRRLMEEQRAKTQAKIQQGNALFQKNMELLKDNYRAMRQKNEFQAYDERTICKQMEQCMKKKKLGQLQELKLLWQQQNLKLNNIIGDEQKIKGKLIDIYRRHRP